MSRPPVAHVIRSYLGLSETFIYQVLVNIRNYECIVLTDEPRNLHLFPYFPLYSHRDISPYSFWWAVNSIGYRFSNKETFFEHIFYFKHVLRKHKVRLIHAHFGPTGVMMLPLKRSLGVPLITTFYGYDMSRTPKEEKWQRAYQRLFREGDLFLVEGSHMQAQLVGLGSPPEKVRIQHIAVDLEKLEYRARTLENGREKAVLLFCGRLTEKKGLVYAIQAVKMAVAEFPDLEFRIIGDGDAHPEVEQFVRQNDMENVVTFLGDQPYQGYVEEMRRAHILIQPSVTAADGDSEGGAPTVLLEAQACGLPVLSTYHADIPEVVRDGQSGFLVPERDVRALAERLVYLLRNPHCWPELGRAGRAHIEANHDIRREAAKLEEIYGSLV